MISTPSTAAAASIARACQRGSRVPSVATATRKVPVMGAESPCLEGFARIASGE